MNEANQNHNNLEEDFTNFLSDSGVVELDANDVSNAVLKRLIEEVKNDKENNVTAYNRLHNRHNRHR
jgi:phage-related protein